MSDKLLRTLIEDGQVSLVAVNSAVSGSVNCPPAEDTGSMSNSEMVRMIRKKPTSSL